MAAARTRLETPNPGRTKANSDAAANSTAFRAKRVVSSVTVPLLGPQIRNVIWVVRIAITPILMILCAGLTYEYFRGSWRGLGLAALCIGAFYLPFIVLTPVRRKGDFFPLGDDGPGLPFIMVIGGGLAGGICGIVLGGLGGERIAIWGGGIVGVIVFHVLYYGTVTEKSDSLK